MRIQASKTKPLVYLAISVFAVSIALFYYIQWKTFEKTKKQNNEEDQHIALLEATYNLELAQKKLESNDKIYLLIKHPEGQIKLSQEINNTAIHVSLLENLIPKGSKHDSVFHQLKTLFAERLAIARENIKIAKLYKNIVFKDFSTANQLNQKQQLNKTLEDFIKQIESDIHQLNNETSADEDKLVATNIKLGILTSGFFLFILIRLLYLISIREKLFKKNQLYEKIINNSSDAVFLTDKFFSIKEINDAGKKIFSSDKLNGISFFSLVTFLNTNLTDEEVVKQIQQKGSWKGKLCLNNKKTQYLLTHITPILNSQKKLEGYFIVNTEITELMENQQLIEHMAESLQAQNATLAEKVEEQTEFIREIFDRVNDVFIATDEYFTIKYAKNFHAFLSVEKNSSRHGENIFEVLNQIAGSELKEQIQLSFEHQEGRTVEFLHSKRQLWYLASIYPSKKGVSIYFKDITISVITMEANIKSKRLIEFISKVNDIILHTKNVSEIYQLITVLAIKTGDFLFAWIGEINHQGFVLPVAEFGKNEGYLSHVNLQINHTHLDATGHISKVFRTKLPFCSNEIGKDPLMVKEKDQALKSGYQSFISLPIIVNQSVVSVLNLYAAHEHFFTKEEQSLLVRITENIGYALTNIAIEQKRIETQKELLKLIRAVEQSSASVMITDKNGKIEYANEAFLNISEFTKEEVIGKDFDFLNSENKSNEIYQAIWDTISANKTWTGEILNKSKSGNLYWENMVISPIHDEQGTITHYVGIKDNINVKKELEFKKMEQLSIFENTSTFIIIGDLNRNITYANESFRNVFGIGNEDISKFSLNHFFTEHTNSIAPIIREALFANKKWNGESVFKTLGGRNISLLVDLVLHKGIEKDTHYVSMTGIDISKLKNAENKLEKQSKELRDLSVHLQLISEAEKKDIAREIHDELGQYLTALKMGVNWLQKHIEADKNILKVKLEELLLGITETLAAFRKIHSSLHPAMLSEIGLDAAAQWFVDQAKKTTNLPIHYHSNIEAEKIEFSYGLAIYRVLQESLNNILKYAKANQVSISILKTESLLTLLIEDDGIGFDTNQVDTTLHHGILGMRERIYALHGEFTIQSSIGKGTSIKVEVDLSKQL